MSDDSTVFFLSESTDWCIRNKNAGCRQSAGQVAINTQYRLTGVPKLGLLHFFAEFFGLSYILKAFTSSDACGITACRPVTESR